MRERPVVTLGAYVDILTGFPFTSRDYVDDGMRLLRGDNIGQGRLRWEGVKYWPRASPVDVSQYHLAPGDVVLAMDRPWIEAGLKFAHVRPADLPCLLVQRVARLRAKQGLDQAFLRFLIGSSAFVNHVLAVQTGSAVPHISAAQIREFEFRLPDVAEQRAVAEVLGALDDKIDANNRIVRLCDDLWLALTSQALDEAAPSGSTVPLTSLAAFVNGRAFTKGATGTGRMVVRIAELNSGPGGSTVYNDLDVPDQHLARPGDLLFAWSGSLTVQRWFRDEAIVNQHIFKVIPGTGVPIWLVHAHLLRLLDGFRAIAADKATTMGHIQRRHLEVHVPELSEEALAELDRRCGPLWRRALAAERETLALTTLRDALLPPLISGQLRVRDAESLVGEAV